MPQNINKTAGVQAKSFNHLVSLLRDATKDGTKFKALGDHTSPDAEQVARHIMFRGKETGSFAGDLAIGALKKVPGKTKAGKNIGEHISDKYSDIQRKLSDVDIKAGSKIHSALDKNPVGKHVSKAFVYDHQIPLAESTHGTPDKLINVSVPALSAPIEKAKKAVLPMAGALYLNDKLNKSEKGGDTVEKKASYKEQLINKIMDKIASENTIIQKQANEEIQDHKIELLHKASIMLKAAADEKRIYEADKKSYMEAYEKLASENKRLTEAIYLKEKTEQVSKLANLMNDKGIIKKADISNKISELLSLDDNAFTIFKSAVENMPIQLQKDGVDSLTFLSEDNNIKYRKETLASSLEDAVNRNNL